jgi:Cu-Zn family superoxide dismutase
MELFTAVISTVFVFAGTASGATVTAIMQDGAGQSIGKVALQQHPNGVLVSADLKGLPAGVHGFHIHAVGSCEEGFKAAKGHFNPQNVSHGLGHGDAMHAGDMPNIFVASDGSVRADVFNHLITLESGHANSIHDADGSSIIIHANADSYGENAGAGARIACGVIQ